MIQIRKNNFAKKFPMFKNNIFFLHFWKKLSTFPFIWICHNMLCIMYIDRSSLRKMKFDTKRFDSFRTFLSPIPHPIRNAIKSYFHSQKPILLQLENSLNPSKIWRAMPMTRILYIICIHQLTFASMYFELLFENGIFLTHLLLEIHTEFFVVSEWDHVFQFNRVDSERKKKISFDWCNYFILIQICI